MPNIIKLMEIYTAMIAEEKLEVEELTWDGTVESYNSIIKKCFPRKYYQLTFHDHHDHPTNEFTDAFSVIFAYSTFKNNKDESLFFDEWEKGKYHHGTLYKAPCVVRLIKD